MWYLSVAASQERVCLSSEDRGVGSWVNAQYTLAANSSRGGCACVCVCERERERVVCVREGMGERKVDNVFNLNWLVASLVINQIIHVRSYDIRLAFSVRSLRK